eukprot:7175259-Pyramimonas_sp.AAC.1
MFHTLSACYPIAYVRGGAGGGGQTIAQRVHIQMAQPTINRRGLRTATIVRTARSTQKTS